MRGPPQFSSLVFPEGKSGLLRVQRDAQLLQRWAPARGKWAFPHNQPPSSSSPSQASPSLPHPNKNERQQNERGHSGNWWQGWSQNEMPHDTKHGARSCHCQPVLFSVIFSNVVRPYRVRGDETEGYWGLLCCFVSLCACFAHMGVSSSVGLLRASQKPDITKHPGIWRGPGVVSLQ